jgi:DeoR/GlpR family transcriptional regulator of sugar metabolism
MFKAARQAKIKEILLDRKQVNVQTLSSILNVSTVTIRSDLEELERMGFIIRMHGGAFLNDSVVQQEEASGFIVGTTVDYDKAKESVGVIASHFVNNSEWIFLGSGTTCYYIARALVNRSNLNVLTNNLLVAYELCKNPGANVIMTGGTLSHDTYNLGGEIFGEYLQSININKAFISIAGIDLNNAYTVSTAGEFNVFQVIRRISKELFIVADSAKFDRTAFIKVGELTAANAIITNQGVSDAYKEYFFNHDIRIFTSYDFADTPQPQED